jgi:D-arabinose 1-dehydrogenase-like Zn-dependent alcohol dehydrogenase/glycosyltransferase involved in cell wall biosynthesis
MEVETSIVVRTLNEERHLGRLLESIKQQTYKAWEIILVDSGSTDSTLEIARRHTPRIYHIPSEEFTFGRSLNLGCSHASGRYLAFASAHVYPLNNTWLSNLIRPFEDPYIGMVYGRQRGMESSRISEERDLERVFGSTSKILIDEPFGNNGNAAIRKDLWLDQPFDETLTGLEDIDWARKIQQKEYRVYYAADSAVYHIHEESLRQVYRRMFREGVGYRRIFPGFRFDKVDLLKGLVYGIAADALYGVRRRKALRKIVQIPSTRIAGHTGLWRGSHHHDKLSRELLVKLQYPKVSQSVVIRAAGQHRIQETEVPLVGPEDVLIQVAYVGVCATDRAVAGGHLEYYGDGHPQYPIVPGHEYSGIVVATGSRVRGLRQGDKVVGEYTIGCGTCPSCVTGEVYGCTQRKDVGLMNMDGAYAKYLKIRSQYVHKLPRDVLLKQGALVGPLAVCLNGLSKLEIRGGAAACVIGAGPLGNLCAQIVKHRGHGVTVVDPNERWLQLLYKYDVDTWKGIESLYGFDYLIDTTGREDIVSCLTEKSKPSPKILLIGLPCGHPVPMSFSTLPCYQDKEVYASMGSSHRDWQEAIRLVSSRTINLDNHTMTVLPLESYDTAWEAVREGELFKVLLLCNSALESF